jgi:hypothetical protein
MTERVETTWHALELVLTQLGALSPGWLVAGVVLHVLHQVVRTRGWFNIIRAAYPEATGLRARDVALAYLAGAGLNSVVPARGGDVAKLYVIRRRAPQTRWSTLVATFVPETLFESLVAVALLLWALGAGLLPAPGRSDLRLPDVAGIGSSAVLFLVVALLGSLLLAARRALRAPTGRLIGRLRQGLQIMRRPRDLLIGVVAWQALGRLIRLGSLAALMAAFRLPLTAATVLLVMAVQGGGRIVPTAPASAGVRIALLVHGFGILNGDAVPAARVTAFSIGSTAILSATAVAITLAILGRELGTASPRTMVRRLRNRLDEPALVPRGASAFGQGRADTGPASDCGAAASV